MRRVILIVVLMMLSGLVKATINCSASGTGIGLCYPNFGQTGDSFITTVRNNFVILNSSVPIATSSPTYTNLTLTGWLHAGSSVSANAGFYGDGTTLTGVATSAQLTSTAAALTAETARAIAQENTIAVSTGALEASKVNRAGDTMTGQLNGTAAAFTGSVTSGTGTITGNAFSVGVDTLSVLNGMVKVGTAPVTNPGNLTVGGKIGAADAANNGVTVYDHTGIAAGTGGQINFGGQYSNSGNYTMFGSIRGYKTAPDDTYYWGGLKFLTHTIANTYVTGMTLDSEANLTVRGNGVVQGNSFSVGTSTFSIAQGKVTVGLVGPNPITSTSTLLNVSDYNTSLPGIMLASYWADATNTRAASIIHRNNARLDFGVSGEETFRGDPSLESNTKMTIMSSGKVGVGIVNPAFALDVAGTGIRVNTNQNGGGIFISTSAASVSSPDYGLRAQNNGMYVVVNDATSFIVYNSKIVMSDGATSRNISMKGGSISFEGNGGGLTFPSGADASFSAKIDAAGNIATAAQIISSGAANNYFAGAVGIGTTAPVGLLSVQQAAGLSGSTPAFTVSSSTYKTLQITADGLSSFGMNSTLGTTYPISVSDYKVAMWNGGAKIITPAYADGEKITSLLTLVNNYSDGYTGGQTAIDFSHTITNYGGEGIKAQIRGGLTENTRPTSSNDLGMMSFLTTNLVSSTLVERMRINQNGVGIGNTNPAYKLDVTGGGHFTSSMTVDGNMNLKTYTETKSSAAVSTNYDISWSSGSVYWLSLTDNVTLTFSGAVDGQSLTLFVKQNVGSKAITWPTISWPSATAPTLTTAAGKTDIISLTYIGGVYYGFIGGQNY